jgi:hypothetical protein
MPSSLEAVEFIRRFLLHVLPLGFIKIRHFGFLANRNRSQALALCRQYLQAAITDHPTPEMLTPQQRQAMERRCPVCHGGTLHVVGWLSAVQLILATEGSALVPAMDSS